LNARYQMPTHTSMPSISSVEAAAPKLRRRLAELLEGEAYAHLDGATKERLLSEVPALAFRPRGMER